MKKHNLHKNESDSQREMPEYFQRIDERELDSLYHQFETMDVDQDGNSTISSYSSSSSNGVGDKGYISENEFKEGLGTILNDDILASALFSLMDEGKDKRIDFKEFLNGMMVLIRGTPREQLECKQRCWRFFFFV